MNRGMELFTAEKQPITFPELLDQAQQYMSANYPQLLGETNSRQKQDAMVSYLQKFIADHNYLVDGMDSERLPLCLYDEMAEFSFLTPFLKGFNIDWEEININRWDDTKISFCDGRVERSKRQFFSPQHAEDIIRRMLRQSGIVLDQSRPMVRGHIGSKIRVTVIGRPVIDADAGITASIRYVNPKKLGREEFIRGGTATGDMLDLLAILYRYGISICLAGATGSGKTTIMAWILSTLPYNKRIYTVEKTTREFDLVVLDPNTHHVLNNVIHTVTRDSDDPKQCITEQMLLEQGLTYDPDYICMAEMKGAEAFETQEATRTGHAVITNLHANSCDEIYDRLLDLCSISGRLSGELLQSSTVMAFPITFYCKKGEDNIRRITEICECELVNGKRTMQTLYHFHTKENKIVNGKTRITGNFEKVGTISDKLQQRLRDNGIPENILRKIVGGDVA